MAQDNITLLTKGYSFEYEKYEIRYFVTILDIFTHRFSSEIMYKIRKESKSITEGSHGFASEEIISSRDMNILLKLKEESSTLKKQWAVKILQCGKTNSKHYYTIVTKYVEGSNKEAARVKALSIWFDSTSQYFMPSYC